jgi:hypothetical protein
VAPKKSESSLKTLPQPSNLPKPPKTTTTVPINVLPTKPKDNAPKPPIVPKKGN